MGFLSKLISAPIRLIDLPNKVMKVLVGDDDKTSTTLDEVAETVEKTVDKIIGKE